MAQALMLWEEMAQNTQKEFSKEVRRAGLLRDAKRVMSVVPKHCSAGSAILVYAGDSELADAVCQLAPAGYLCVPQVHGAMPAAAARKAEAQFGLKTTSFSKPVRTTKQTIALPEHIPKKGELKWMALFVGTPDKAQVLAVNHYQYENYNKHTNMIVLGDTVPATKDDEAVACFFLRGRDV